MTNKNTHILVIDDDRRLRTLLEKFLNEYNYYISTASDVNEARELMKKYTFNMLIVDIMMPGETGIEFTKSLRAKNIDLPILMLTAMGETDDRINGLESGVDDYLCKPFEPKELVLRIEAILKRYNQHNQNNTNIAIHNLVKFGGTSYNKNNGWLENNETQEISALTTTENTILKYLIDNLNKTVTRQQLMEHLNTINNTELNERSIDVHINRLRQRIEKNPKKPIYLQTVRGEGYKLIQS